MGWGVGVQVLLCSSKNCWKPFFSPLNCLENFVKKKKSIDPCMFRSISTLCSVSLIYICLYANPDYYSFFFKIDLYWSIIASRYCVSFCCTTKRISHMHTHVPISPPSWASLPSSLSHPSRSSQSTETISLCCAAASHQPTTLHSVVYMCQCYSHFAPASPSHPMSSRPFSMSASLFLPCN